MPIREYHCAQCHEDFEELVFGDDAPPCPSCGSRNVEGLMSCCCVRGGVDAGMGAAMSGGGKSCSGCAGGSCASCH